MPDLQNNPFIVGQPLPPEYFVGQSAALQTVVSRLGGRVRQSTSIVGANFTGRTSFLRYLASQVARSRHPELSPYWPVIYEALPDTNLTQEMFWIEVLQRAGDVCEGEDIQDILRRDIDMASGGHLSRPDLQRAFDHIGATGHTLLLIVDDFNCLMELPELIPPKNNQFFEIFRHMCILQSQGLAMIVATPRPLVDLWKYPHGSIFFNTFDNAIIGKLADDEIANLLDNMLAGTGVQFTAQDIREINKRSSNLPAYVQYYASLLFTAHQQNLDQDGRRKAVQQAVAQPTNTHITLDRSLIQRMNDLEKRALEKYRRSPANLTEDERKLLLDLDARGGLPPGVKL